LDDLVDSAALSSAAYTPRGTLKHALRTKVTKANGGLREEYDLVSHPEPAANGKAHTTHIHVYPPLAGGLTSPHSRSLPALKSGGLLSPKSPASATKYFASPSKRLAMDDAEAEYEALENHDQQERRSC
jgi:hypothetical protein